MSSMGFTFDSATDTPDPNFSLGAVHLEDGTVEDAKRDGFGNAVLTVRLRGGRVIGGVPVLGGSQGVASGESPVAPHSGATEQVSGSAAIPRER